MATENDLGEDDVRHPLRNESQIDAFACGQKLSALFTHTQMHTHHSFRFGYKNTFCSWCFLVCGITFFTTILKLICHVLTLKAFSILKQHKESEWKL